MQAIEFVSMQQDDELWEELIKQSFHKPEMVSSSLPFSPIIVTKRDKTDSSLLCFGLSFLYYISSYFLQVGVLLEHTVGNLDPLYIVNMLPNGLEIPR